jgi:DNA-binding XRE family transcriptional regulator
MTTVYDPRVWAWQERAGCRLSVWPTPNDFTTADPYRLTEGNRRALRHCRTVCTVRLECFAATQKKPKSERKSIIAGGALWTVQGQPLLTIPSQRGDAPRPPRRMSFEHGSINAYNSHRNHGEPICDVCVAGHTQRRLERIHGGIPDEVIRTLSDAVYKTRKHRKLSRQNAALQIGIAVSTLYYIETDGRKPHKMVLEKVLAWLKTEETPWITTPKVTPRT